MNNKVKILYFLLGVFIVSSCKKLDMVPTDRYTEENYWTSYEKADQVLNTAYGQMVNPDYFFYNNALSDDAYDGRGDEAGVSSISSGTYDPSLNRLDDEWKFHYQGIKTSNTILRYIDRVPDMTTEQRDQIVGQAVFLRAFHYFKLATWWGDVPYFTKEISIEESQTVKRAPHEAVIDSVLKELDRAENLLPVKSEYSDDDLGRISKGAVIALKARIYLYEEQWDEVVKECEKLIKTDDNGDYDLFSSYAGLFLPENENNEEVILSAGYVPELRTYRTLVDMVPISVGARLNALAPTQELVNDYLMLNGKTISESGSGFDQNNPYENRDPRLTATIVYDGYIWKEPDGSEKTIYIKPGSDPDQNAPDEYKPGTVASPTGYYLRKYYDPTATNFESGLDLILIRYADVLLMYAEAKNELGDFDQEVWSETIKQLRSRAGFTDASALDYHASWSQGQLREIIRRERRSELAMEGLRIFDIRRWKIADAVMNGYVHGARFGSPGTDDGYVRATKRTFDPSRGYLWPIPRNERALNGNLGQNPGW